MTNAIRDDEPLSQLMDHAPVQRFRGNDGATVEEQQTLVGWVAGGAGSDPCLALLEELGVCLDYAYFDPESARWERCLFSEGVAEMLEDLYQTGEFPFPFEAVPSDAEAEWIQQRAHGATERLPRELRAFLTPASIEVLDDLAFQVL